MAKEMLINVSADEECRIALLDNGKLEELYMERNSATSHVGNIYKGKVTNVEPSIQAAFVDFGIGRNGFLHITDLLPQYFGKKGDNSIESVGRKLSRRDRPPIQQCLRKGDEVIVQIIKEGIGTKGPTLSTYLSVPGRVLVMMPGMSKMGISKKIEDEVERTRLRKILDGLKPPKDCGFIIRTAGIGKSKLEIERDLKYLARLWETLKKKIDKEKPPVELFTEGDLVTRTVRDIFTSDIDAIVVDDAETAKKIKDFIKLAMPRTKNKVQLYEEPIPLFHSRNIESIIEEMYSKRVPLPSGGSLIIDQTEAVVAIDVNSGKFRDHSDAETTAYKTDMEAADEIPRQLKLRDLGGVIICDFIDLRFDRHRREVEQRLYDNLKNDRAKTRMLRMSHFGIIEMTRQRMRPSLKKSIYHECSVCLGHGMVKTNESIALDVMRRVRIGLNDAAVVRVKLTLHPDVALHLLNRKRAELAALEEETSKKIDIASQAGLGMDEVRFELFDARDGFIFIADLGMEMPSHGHASPRGQERGDRRDGRGRHDRRPRNDKREEESEAIDASELFDDAGDSEKKKETKKPDRKIKKDGEEGDESEEVSEVVDIEDGGAETPFDAPQAFFDPSDEPRHLQRRNNNNRNDRNDRRPQRGGDHRNAPRNDQRNDPRGEQRGDPRDAQRGGYSRDQRLPQGGQNRSPGQSGRHSQGQPPRHQQGPRPQQPPLNKSAPTDIDGDIVEGEEILRPLPQLEGGPISTDQQQGDEGTGRRRRRRRGRRGRGGKGGQAQNDLPQSQNLAEGESDVDGHIDDDGPQPVIKSQPYLGAPVDEVEEIAPYDDPETDQPAPGNELARAERPVEDRNDKNGRRRNQQRSQQGGRGGRDNRGGQNREGRSGQGGYGQNRPQNRPGNQSSFNAPQRKPPRTHQNDDAPVLPAPIKVRSESTPPPIPQPPVVKTGSTDRHHLHTDTPIDPQPISRPRSFRDMDVIPDDYD